MKPVCDIALGSIIVLVALGVSVTSAGAEGRSPSKSQSVARPTKSHESPPASSKHAVNQAKKSQGAGMPLNQTRVKSDRLRKIDQQQAGRAEPAKPSSNTTNPKRLAKLRPNHKPKATIRLKPVESPARLIEPGRHMRRMDHNHDGLIDPMEKELARDHFIELDKNRDGAVDPMERALNRVDMHYDGEMRP